MVPLIPDIPPQPPAWRRALSLVVRWLISTLAIFAAVLIVPGITFDGPGWELGIVAAIFGLINVLLKPLLTLLTCPLILLTFGLFGLAINAGLLLLTAAIADQVGVAFDVAGFWPAVLGGLLISVVSAVLSYLAGESQFTVVRATNNNNLQ